MNLNPSPPLAGTPFANGLVKSPVTTGAITLYVATTGSDSNDGLTAGTPLLSITTALNKLPTVVNHTPTINVAAGTYTEQVIIPQRLLSTSVLIVGASMASTAPTTGITSGTFDASFGTPLFPNIATVAGAGWTVDGLVGFFVQMTSGTQSGARLPIISNTATTVTLGTYVNTSAYQGQTFTLVKPVVLLNNSANEAVSAWGISGGSTNGSAVGVANYFTFSNFQFTRSGSQSIFRGSGYTTVMFANCSFFDGGGGGYLNRYSSIARFDDCLFYKSAANNTSFHQVASSATGIFNRCVFSGGNTHIFASGMATLVMASGFFMNAGAPALSISGCPGNILAAQSFYNCSTAVLAFQNGSFQLTNAIIKNCTTGLAIGFSAPMSAQANVICFNALIDGCTNGIVLGCTSAFTPSSSGTNTIKNCTAFGVNLAPGASCSHNSYSHFTGLISMSGNTADFTLDGTTGISLATLQAASNKTITDATRFNRIVEA